MPSFIRIKSALIRVCWNQIQVEWTPQFEKNPKAGVFTRKLDRILPQKHIMSLYKSPSTKKSVLLIHFHTDNNRLQMYLYRQKLAQSDWWKCGQKKDSTWYLLWECLKWESQRQIPHPQAGVDEVTGPICLVGSTAEKPEGSRLWMAQERTGSHLSLPWRLSLSLLLLLINLQKLKKTKQKGSQWAKERDEQLYLWSCAILTTNCNTIKCNFLDAILYSYYSKS